MEKAMPPLIKTTLRHNLSAFSSLVLAIFLLVIALPLAAEAPGDLVFERKGDTENVAFPPSIFQHWVHRIQYRCDACHESQFKMKAGETEVSMALIGEGKVCGVCHNGRRAFDTSFENCQRCHRVPE
jgi:c(7)-type cytochrome triheme protein